MDFTISCRCGRTFSVTEGSAGSALACACGEAVRVPSISELRQRGLVEELNPILEIEYLVARAELPQGSVCCRCGEPANEVLPALAQCEKTRRHGPSGWSQLVLSFILFLFGGWLIILLQTIIRSEERLIGKELAVSVPLRMCKTCCNHMRALSKKEQQKVLRDFLAKAPIYRRLLERYPEARLVVLSSSCAKVTGAMQP